MAERFRKWSEEYAIKRLLPELIRTAQTIGLHANFNIREQSEQSDVLEELADGTGGAYFHNNNDLKGGFQRLASAPTYSYLLGFSPLKAVYDGKGTNLAPSGASRITVDAKTGKLVSFR